MLHLVLADYTIEIDAPVAEVFALFKDVARWSQWASGIRRARPISSGGWRVGYALMFVPTFLPLPMTPIVQEYEENRRIAWGLRTPIATIVHAFDFESIDGARCRLRNREHTKGLLSLVAWPLREKIRAFDQGWSDDARRRLAKGAEDRGAGVVSIA